MPKFVVLPVSFVFHPFQDLRECLRAADVWAVSAGQLNRFHSEQLLSSLALPRWRDRPVVGTHNVRGRYRGPEAQWTRFLYGALRVEHQPGRHCPVETIRGTIVVHEVQSDFILEGILSDPGWVEYRRIGPELLDDTH